RAGRGREREEGGGHLRQRGRGALPPPRTRRRRRGVPGARGGGRDRRRLAAAGPIVCLAASPEEILRRVGDPLTRPLLAGGSAGGDRLARIRQLLAERAPAYALATHAVDTS